MTESTAEQPKAEKTSTPGATDQSTETNASSSAKPASGATTSSTGSVVSLTIHALLRELVARNASDLHITTGTSPHFRVDGKLKSFSKTPPLRPLETEALCYDVLNQDQRAEFEANNELDFSFGIRGLARFRASLFRQRGSVGGVFRVVPFRIRSLEELGLPKVIQQLANKPRGLILVTGSAGSGKSTTLAAIIDQINRTRYGHIITIEDPIEFIHPHHQCIVNQREVGNDTVSFKRAIRQVLRLDPDVIQVGEIRDFESLEATLSLAETGHLVLATLHTNSAIQSLHRMVDLFPPHQQDRARIQLSFVLQAVLCQQLIPRVGGGRVLALEMMYPTPAIRHLIREEKVHQIYSQIQIGKAEHGMQTLNQALVDLYEHGFIQKEHALASTSETNELLQMLAQVSPKESTQATHPLLRGKK